METQDIYFFVYINIKKIKYKKIFLQTLKKSHENKKTVIDLDRKIMKAKRQLLIQIENRESKKTITDLDKKIIKVKRQLWIHENINFMEYVDVDCLIVKENYEK